jgi:peptide/nickel transport system ATP-binding protein
MPSLLSVSNLTIGFQSGAQVVEGVRNVGFEVNRGEILAIVGESGSGKSITALSILQLLPPSSTRISSGEILFQEHTGQTVDLLQLGSAQMRRIRGKQISMIFQEPMVSLNPVFTCGAQVMEAIRAHGRTRASEAKRRTLELFDQVKLPDPASLFGRYPHQLSGGQKQRVMIAMAMSCKPSLLICDEPTTALDVTVQHTILQIIRELCESERLGVIFITHDLGVVAEIADRVLVLYKGNIVEQGPVKQLFAHPTHPYTKGLLHCRPQLHQKGERLPVVSDYMPSESGPIDPLLDLSTAASKTIVSVQERDQVIRQDALASSHNSVSTAATRPVILRVEDLSVWFKTRKAGFRRKASYLKAVNRVSFDVYKGETLGLVGESGCGKTTLGRCLLRLLEPRSGKIFFDGSDLLAIQAKHLKKFRKEIQIVFQDPYSSLNPRLKIGRALEEPLQVHRLLRSETQRKDKVSSMLNQVDLDPSFGKRYPHEFSGGQRQRIVIARALIVGPSFVVFDESVSALDVSVQAQVLNLINDLKAEFGFTAIFISHDLSVIRYISDRILVMNQGEIVETGSSEDIYLRPQHPYTRKLVESVPAMGL